MRYLFAILMLPIALVVTSPLAGQDADRGRRAGEDRERPSAAVETPERNRDARANERDEERRAMRGPSDDRRERVRRGPRRDAQTRDGDRSARRSWEGRRRGPRFGRGGIEDVPRGPSARMLLARFDRDGDRELDLRELTRLVDQVPSLRAFGPGARGPAAWEGRGGPLWDGPRDGREFNGSAGRPGARLRDGAFGRPRGPRRDGPPERLRETFGPRGGDEDRGERGGSPSRRDEAG